MENFAVEKNCKWIKPGTGFDSYNDFQRRIELLAKSYEDQWKCFILDPTEDWPQWAPQGLEVWKRDSLAALREQISDPCLAQDMKWAPEKLFNEKNERLYTDLFSADW